jgi:hypothetical protein
MLGGDRGAGGRRCSAARQRGAQARRQQGGLGRWKDREVTRGRGEKQEVGAGDQGWFTAPAAEAPGAEQRGQGLQEEEGGKNEAGDCFAKSEKNRDLTVKSLQLLNQCSNGDGPKSFCIVFQTLQLLFKVHLLLSNSFEDTIHLVIISNFM